MDRLRAKYRASGKELKGRAAKKWPKLTMDLLGMLYEDGVPIFIELMDKWHYVASNITTFVLGSAPWFELGSPASRRLANPLADLIVEEFGTYGAGCIQRLCPKSAREYFGQLRGAATSAAPTFSCSERGPKVAEAEPFATSFCSGSRCSRAASEAEPWT